MTSSQASSNNRSGHAAGRGEEGGVGLGPTLERPLGAAADRFTSTRLEVTPISRLDRAPDRSSPVHVVRPSVGAVAR